METNFFENIAFQERLKQSQVFGEQYGLQFGIERGGAFSSPVFSDVEDILNNILFSYNSLTEFQVGMLNRIFNALNNVRHLIDPNRLKPFEHFLNDDEELLLYRKTETGLINIIIHSEGCVAYSFIGTAVTCQVLEFFYEDSDFESLVYKFFSY